ncbi:MAG: chemotaxis protein CheR [Rhodospirillaceae bacterium]|nr:chemotaxis protein CheR [Rhodospirillaceae bacterium]MCA8932570.1 chemotaxis protein CheR [Rhodospirillaceae bacterium]
MRPDDFNLFQSLLKQRSGLVITSDKAYLLESRLMPVARKWQLRGLEDLATACRGRRDERLLRDIIEAMTTSETSFFRGLKPFEMLRSTVLPALRQARAATRELRIWSAACSSGQEPYSIAMMLREAEPQWRDWQIELLGTDISTDILTRARSGSYTQFEVQRGLPIAMLLRYFDKAGDKWVLKPEIRSMVAFRDLNLLANLAPLGRFDLILCRHVLVYFDQPTRALVLDKLAKLLPDDGVLMLGDVETVSGLTDKLRPIDGLRGAFQPTRGAAHPRQVPPSARPAAAVR